MTTQIDVLGVGAVAVDDILVVANYPAADAKAEVLDRRRVCGGLAGTALVAAARLGASCAYAGSLGHDELSAFAIDCLAREGVSIDHVVLTATGRPIHSVVVVDSSHGTRNIFFDQRRFVGPSAHAPTAALIRRSHAVLVDHLSLDNTIRVAGVAREAGVAVVADLEGGAEERRFEELVELIDHLIVAEEFAIGLTGANSAAQAVDALWSDARAAVVVTCGAAGCWYRDSTSGPTRRPAFPVDARDTTGCGDIFHGAYAAALVRGLDLAQRVRFAAGAAALAAASGEGGQAAAPSETALAALLTDTRIGR